MRAGKKLSHHFTAAAIIIILIAAAVQAETKKPRVALLNITAKNTSATYGEVVGDILEVAIYKTGRFDLLERNRVSSILKEQDFQGSGCTDEACAVEIGKLLSAEMVILGSIIKLGSFTITLKLVDIQKGRVIVADSGTAATESDIQSAVDKIAERIADKMEDIVNERHRTAKKEETAAEEPEKEEPSVITPAGYYLRGIVPGWGQIYAGESLKGFTCIGCFVLTGAAAVFGYNYYNDKKNEYDKLPKGETKETYDKKYNDYKLATNIAVYSAGLFALSYIANWVDLIFFTEPEYGKVIGAVKYDNSYVDINLYAGYGAYRESGLSFSCGMRF